MKLKITFVSIFVAFLLVLNSCQQQTNTKKVQDKSAIILEAEMLEDMQNFLKLNDEFAVAKIVKNFGRYGSNNSKYDIIYLLKENKDWRIFCVTTLGQTSDCVNRYLELRTTKLTRETAYNFKIKYTDVETYIDSAYPNLPEVNKKQLIDSEFEEAKRHELGSVCKQNCKDVCADYKYNSGEELIPGENSYSCTCYCSNKNITFYS